MSRNPSYRQIREFVWERYGVRIWKDCHIADALRQRGLTNGPSPNRKSPDSVQYQCPATLRPKIEHALRHFGVKLRAPNPDAASESN